MRMSVITLALGVAVGIGAGIAGTSLARAQSNESFTLDQHDQVIVEAPGCYADCRVMGPRRLCTMKSPDCKAVCRTLPQCRIDGKAMQVCAVIRTDR